MHYSDETKEKARMMYVETGNMSEVARRLGVPCGTVSRWVNNSSRDELEGLRNEKKKDIIEAAAEDIKSRRADFIEQSSRALRLALDVLEMKLSAMLEEDGPAVTVNQLSTVINTLYDKRALAKGESTQNTSVMVKLPEEAQRYAE
ncbi:MAG: transposase [Oscillospiraceae bacterium]|nr:transposase [Oscillospiraceae bacterium]